MPTPEEQASQKIDQQLAQCGWTVQRRLRIGDEWYRIDLLFFHRRLRCLVVIDLKLGKFTHADAGQMHLYQYDFGDDWDEKTWHELTSRTQWRPGGSD